MENKTLVLICVKLGAMHLKIILNQACGTCTIYNVRLFTKKIEVYFIGEVSSLKGQTD
jgi:hypothetical protein